MRAALVLALVCATAGVAHAGIDIKGTPEDVKAFKHLLEECAQHSPAFKKCLDGYEQETDHTITVNVGHTGDYVDKSGDGSSTTINLDNLDKLPEPDVVNGKATMPKGHPPWALTRTELLLHVLAETRATSGAGFSPGAHQKGIQAQFAVRKDFGQDAHAVHKQLIIDGGFLIELDLYCEKLIFEGGVMHIYYFKGRNCDEPLKTSLLLPHDDGATFFADLGAAVPFGDYEQGLSQDSEYAFAAPVEVGAGYTFGDPVFVGGYFSFGPAFVPGSSCNGASCSGNDLRFGVVGLAGIPILRSLPIKPWAGGGIGYELSYASFDVSGHPPSNQTVRGFDGNLSIGADYPLGDQMKVGGFLRFDLGEYDHASGTVNGASYSQAIAQTTLHEWLTLGVRGSYHL